MIVARRRKLLMPCGTAPGMAWCPRASSSVSHTEVEVAEGIPDGFWLSATLETGRHDVSRWRCPLRV